MSCSALEIYNEHITDLLGGPRASLVSLALRETLEGTVYVEGLEERAVDTSQDACRVLEDSMVNRRVASTAMNKSSSRSHFVFAVRVTVREGSVERYATLNVVDLAGSERQKAAQTSGARLREATHINTSLLALGKVISQLARAAEQRTAPGHVSFRDSKLTHLLRDSLGGSCKTRLIACVSAEPHHAGETLSTLQFARRAMSIRNVVVAHERALDRDNATLRAHVDSLEQALARAQSAAADAEARHAEELRAFESHLEETMEAAQRDSELQHAEHQRAIQTLEKSLAAERDQVERDTRRLAEADAREEEAKCELDLALSRFDTAMHRADTLEEQLSVLLEAHKEAEQDKALLEERVDSLSAELVRLTDDVVPDLESSLMSARTRATQQEHEWRGKYEEQLQANIVIQEQLASARHRIAELEEHVEGNMARELQEAQDRAGQVAERRLAAEHSLEATRARYEKLELEMQDVASGRQRLLEAQLDESRVRLRESTRRVDELEAQVEHLRGVETELQSAQCALESEHSWRLQAEKVAAELQQELGNRAQRAQELDATLRRLQIEHAAVLRRRKALAVLATSLHMDRVETHEQVRVLRGSHANAVKHHASLESTAALALADRHRVQLLFASLQREHRQLCASHSVLAAHTAKQDRELCECRDTLKRTEARAQELEHATLAQAAALEQTSTNLDNSRASADALAEQVEKQSHALAEVQRKGVGCARATARASGGAEKHNGRARRNRRSPGRPCARQQSAIRAIGQPRNCSCHHGTIARLSRRGVGQGRSVAE